MRRFCGSTNIDVNLSESNDLRILSVYKRLQTLMVFKMIDYDESGEVDTEGKIYK